MKPIMNKLKSALLLLVATILIASCSSVERDSQKICDCYKSSEFVKCTELYSEYLDKYKDNTTDMTKLMSLTGECIEESGLSITDLVSTAKKDYSPSWKYYALWSILIVFGVILAIFGLRYFSLGVGLSIVVHMLVLFNVIGYMNKGLIITALCLGVLAFFFTKPLSYIVTWFYTCLFISLPFYMLLESESLRSLITKIAMLASVGVVFIIRKEVKMLVVGMTSGYSVGLGLAGIIAAELFLSGEILNSMLVPGLLVFTSIVLGIAYQYYTLKKTKTESTNVVQDIEKIVGDNPSQPFNMNKKVVLYVLLGFIALSAIIALLSMITHQKYQID